MDCIIPTCRHILDNGSLCRCAATCGQARCRHHLDSALRSRRMARARRRRYPFWLAPLQAATTFRDRTNALEVALELGDIDLSTAQTMLSCLRARQSVDRQIERMSKPPGTPKSYRLYQVPASYLFLQVCRKNIAQVPGNTRWEKEINTNHNSCDPPA